MRPSRVRWRRCVLLLAAGLATGGCATTVTARHSPLYRAVAHESTITASARNSTAGIRRITITVVTGEMTDCTELTTVPSVFPCRRDAITVDHVCEFADRPANATCAFKQRLDVNRLVAYRAVAQPAMGGSVKTPAITYAGGLPLEASIARPAWWHTGEALRSKLDVGFFPDDKYDFYSTFTNHLNTILEGAFFNTAPAQDFARLYGLFHHSFNLFAAPSGASTDGCTRTFGPLVRPIAAVMDGDTIVHPVPFRDCASLSLGGGGSVSGTDVDADFTFVHESGHFLHGQGDEYCCDGGYAFTGDCGNVFKSLEACRAMAVAFDLQDDCKQLNPSRPDVFINQPVGQLEIMDVRIDTSDWRDNTDRCVSRRFAFCGGGSCY